MVLGLNLLACRDLCVEFFHILPVPAWVLTCVFPQSRDMHVILTGDSKSATGFNVTLNASVCDSSDVFSPSPLLTASW